MAKNSFITQLFQGFIRSGVNQVGRDGGKVISNRVYKDSHSVPLRRVSGQYPTGLPQSHSITEENQVPPFFSSAIWVYPFQLLGGLIISPLSVIYHLAQTVKYAFMINPEMIPEARKIYLIKSALHLILAFLFGWLAFTIISFIKSQ